MTTMQLSDVGAQELDEFWEKLVLGAVGELIDPGNEVTGVRVIHKVVDGVLLQHRTMRGWG